MNNKDTIKLITGNKRAFSGFNNGLKESGLTFNLDNNMPQTQYNKIDATRFHNQAKADKNQS